MGFLKSFRFWGAALVLTCTVFIGLILFRKSLVKVIAISYFKTKNITLDFKVEKLSLSEVFITDINIDDGLTIPTLHIVRKRNSSSFSKIEKLTLDISSLNIDTAEELITKLTSIIRPSTNSHKTTLTPQRLPSFDELNSYCQMVLPTEIHVLVRKLVHKNQTIPLNLKLEHVVDAEKTFFSFKGDPLTLQKKSQFELSTSDYFGNLEFSCRPDQISIVGTPLSAKINHLLQIKPFLKITNSSFLSKNLKIDFFKNNELNIDIPLSLKIDLKSQNQNLVIEIPSSRIWNPQTTLTNVFPLSLTARDIKMTQPFSLSVKNLSLDTKNFYFKDSIEATLNAKDITYWKTVKDPYFKGVSISSQIKKIQNQLSALVTITDQTQNLSLKNIQVTKTDKDILIKFRPHTSKIHFNSQIPSLFPALKENIKSITGVIHLDGQYRYKNEAPLINLRIQAQDISLTSGYGDIKNLNWDHTLISLDSWASPSKQKLSFLSLSVGQNIENFYLNYHVLQKNNILAHSVHFEFDKAKIDAKDFNFNPIDLELSGFKALITHLKLEKILSSAIGPLIKAEGFVSGHLNLDLKNKIPILRGNLTTDTAGWIRYRKQGVNQNKTINLSDNPMDILESYLYNFQYKELSLDINSDLNYEMKAVLSTLGENPDYLKGKPLKLKVNLEQNLLAAIKSMMLSFDLPKKLKEKLEER